jgi:hypothetical protein
MIVEKIQRKYKRVVLLGNGVDLDGKLPSHVVGYVGEAAPLLRAGMTDGFIPTGRYSISYTKLRRIDPEAEIPKITEAKAMERELLRRRVPAAAIGIDEKAQDLVGNLLFVRDNHVRPTDKDTGERIDTGIDSILVFCAGYYDFRADEVGKRLYIPEVVGENFVFDVFPVARDYQMDDKTRREQEYVLGEQMGLLGRIDIPRDVNTYDLYADPVYQKPIDVGANVGIGMNLEDVAARLRTQRGQV